MGTRQYPFREVLQKAWLCSDDTQTTVELSGMQVVLVSMRDDPEFAQDALGSSRGQGCYYYITVSDVDKAYALLQKKGLRSQTKPRNWPWEAREFLLKDPDGYKWVVSQTTYVRRHKDMSARNISHIEIPAKNREQLADFYTKVFEWDIEDMLPKAKVPYTVWHAGNMRGGIPVDDKAGTIGSIVIYIASEDIDADLHAIEMNGGKILLAKTEYPAGWFAHFADPAGNRLGLSTTRKS